MPTSTAEDLNRRGSRGDYYNRLSHGFLSGHLYMQVDPVRTPAVEAAELHLGNMPFLLDASFYQKQYYLYFGPTPVVVLFLPYRLVTGSDLSDHLAAALFSSLGLAAWAWLLWKIFWRYHSDAPSWVLTALILLIGLGNAIPIMLRRAMFYETAIGSAYFFCALAALAIYNATQDPFRRRRTCGYLAAGSLAFGLAVGSRASYALGGLGLLIPFFWSCRRRQARWRRPGTWLPELAATLIPIGLCAFLLALYNYERFGDPLEFGVKYQFTYKPVFGLRFAWYNLKLYYGLLAQYSQYFPFAFPVNEGVRPRDYVGFEHLHGQAWILLLLPVLLGALVLRARRRTPPGVPGAFRLFLWFVFANNFVVLLCLAGRANRYAVDFHPLLLFQIALAALALHPGRTSRLRWPWAVLLVSATGWGAAHNIFSGIQLYNILQGSNPHLYQALAHSLNQPTVWRQDSLSPAGGAVRMQVAFPRAPRGAIEPLLVTGGAEYSDYILVQYLEGDQVMFIFAQPGYPSAKSAPISIARDHPHELEIDLGSLYPPREHPFFSRTPRGVVTLLKRRVHLALDGKTLLETASSTYDASPGEVHVGTNPYLLLGGSRRFTGVIDHISRAGWEAGTARLAWPDFGAVELQLQLPSAAPGSVEPLVVTGEPGSADGIYLRYVDASHVRFGSDRMGLGGSEGPVVALDFNVPHLVEVEMGSLYLPASDPRMKSLPEFTLRQLKNLARVKVDGVEVFRSAGQFHEAAPQTLDVGGNAAGMSSMSSLFSGTILAVHRQPIPAARADAGAVTGPVRLSLRWPEERHGQSEPLVAVGRTGRADVMFVNYLDDGHIRFGLDHWGVGVEYSRPLAIDPATPAEVEINFAPLFPMPPLVPYSPYVQSRLEQWRDQYSIIYNGTTVFSGHCALYTSTSPEIEIGTNLVGASSCASSFTGNILQTIRPFAAGAALPPATALLEVTFPRARAGVTEPLLVSGRPGAADALLVTYLDDAHLQFSWDHWGTGGPVSPPIAIEPGRVHRLEIQMGSLYKRSATPEAATGAEIISRNFRVRLDEETVMQSTGEFYPADGCRVGRNDIGLSSARTEFSGTIEYYRGPAPPPSLQE